MATKVHMEALSPTMEEGQVVKWLKAEGEEVSKGDVLAEIETDKATMELVARGDGLLRSILVAEGGTAPVGDVIGIIATADEDITSLLGSGAAVVEESVADPSPPSEKGEHSDPSAAGDAEAAAPPEVVEPSASSSTPDGRVKSSPLARRLADEAGLDLVTVSGSGPGGRIVKRDIEAAIERGAPEPSAALDVASPVPLTPDEDYEDIPLSQIRKTIAKRLAQSIGPVPHFFLTIDVDMTRTVEARRRINTMLEAQGQKISINDMIIRATAAALRRHPECNAAWHGDRIRRYHRVHIGVAVAVEDGLITPIVRDAHAKGVAAIGAEVRELAGRAKQKKLKPEEYIGATFSISNLGMFGIHEFTAVINPPEAGILAIGAIADAPVVINGQVAVQTRMRITMSCDHRVIDGAQGARFLGTLRAMLEEPAAILA